MVKTIGILGSTGSIGTQTLEVVRALNSRPETVDNPHIHVKMLTCGANRALLLSQINEFKPDTVCTATAADAEWVLSNCGQPGLTVLCGEAGLEAAACTDGLDLLVTAIVGMRGLKPTLAAIDRGIDIALANKETLVAAGSIVTASAAAHNVRILPVDSEHSAIFQCLESAFRGGREAVSRLILTASGGPFRGLSAEQLENITPREALMHPTWKMGGKITVDCATMMNKGLEVIEAMHLFGVSPYRIAVNVHPESIVHSMVEFRDGSVIAQLANPDMKLPIQLALTYPYRAYSDSPRLDLTALGRLTFERPRTDVFRCLKLAYDAAYTGGTLPAVLNGANEAAVELFLGGKLGFGRIPEVIEAAMDAHMAGGAGDGGFVSTPTLEAVLAADRRARESVRRITNCQ